MPRPVMNVIVDFTAGPPNTPTGAAVSLLGANTAVRTITTSRGRQYELGTVQAGTCSLDVVDSGEYLNPANTSSPWNSGPNSLLPYRCVQVGAWWRQATMDTSGNLLNSTNRISGSTTPFDPSFESGTGGWFADGTAAALAQSTTQAFDGTHSLAVTVAKASDHAICGVQVRPGVAHTFSVYVWAPAGSTVTASLLNYPARSTIASATSTTTGAWQRLTMTGTPSQQLAIMQVSAPTGTYNLTFYVDAMQLEFASSASPYTASGPTYYPIYTGYIERYPQTWDNAGFRGVRPLEAVDALSVLSRTVISQSYQQTIMADGPTIYMPLNDAAAPQAVELPRGGQPFLGYTQLGSQSGAVNFGGDSTPDGNRAVTVVQQNKNPPTNSDNTMITYLGTLQGSYMMNPQSFTIELWAKVVSGTPYFGAAAMGVGESTVGEVTGPNNWLGWYTSQGAITVYYKDPNQNTVFNNNFSTAGVSTYPDGQWHYWNIIFQGGSHYTFQRDNHVSTVHTFAAAPSTAVQLNNFFVESTTSFGDAITQIAVANIAVYATPLTSTQVTNHYQRGIGYLGELAGNRANRLLSQYWSTNIVADAGKAALSPDFYYCPPVQPGQASQAKSVLAALQDVADTEGGQVWADGGGVIHFDSRETRYIKQVSAQFVFGENTAAGELPYVSLEYDFDPTYVYSEAQLTCDYTGNVMTATNATSQNNYGQRIISKTLYLQSEWDTQQAANFYTQRYAAPRLRIRKLTIDPASNPNLWAAALGMEIGTRITVKRRTSAGTVISGDYYVEQIQHHGTANTSEWTTDIQASPVFVPQAWKLGDSTNGVLGSTTVCVY